MHSNLLLARRPLGAVAGVFLLSLAGVAVAGDDPSAPLAAPPPHRAPAQASNELVFTAQGDNEDNQGSGKADGDMGYCIYNNFGLDPVEFNIVANQGSNGRPATLEIEASDVDSADGERDAVMINGAFLGYLEGESDNFTTTKFDVPDVIHPGNNLVQIFIDTINSGVWCAGIFSGTVRIAKEVAPVVFKKVWAAPVEVRKGDPVTFYAEVGGLRGANGFIKVLRDGKLIAKLDDADGDGLFSGPFDTSDAKPGEIQFTLKAFRENGSEPPMLVQTWPEPLAPAP